MLRGSTIRSSSPPGAKHSGGHARCHYPVVCHRAIRVRPTGGCTAPRSRGVSVFSECGRAGPSRFVSPHFYPALHKATSEFDNGNAPDPLFLGGRG